MLDQTKFFSAIRSKQQDLHYNTIVKHNTIVLLWKSNNNTKKISFSSA